MLNNKKIAFKYSKEKVGDILAEIKYLSAVEAGKVLARLKPDVVIAVINRMRLEVVTEILEEGASSLSIARLLEKIPPRKAFEILNGMSDDTIIEVLKCMEEGFIDVYLSNIVLAPSRLYNIIEELNGIEEDQIEIEIQEPYYLMDDPGSEEPDVEEAA